MFRRHYIIKMEKTTPKLVATHIRLITWKSWFPEPDEVLKYVIDNNDGYEPQDMKRIK